MRITVILAAALVICGCAQHPSAGGTQSDVASSWSTILGEQCRRCVSSKSVQEFLPFALPKRAIIFGFTGEFASRVDTWMVNLDTGEITKYEAISDSTGSWKTTTSLLGTVDPSALERLRNSAAALWRSERYDQLKWLSPGTFEEDEVVSGSRLVAFSRFAPNDHDIVAAIHSALPPDAARTNGSFVIFGHDH